MVIVRLSGEPNDRHIVVQVKKFIGSSDKGLVEVQCRRSCEVVEQEWLRLFISKVEKRTTVLAYKNTELKGCKNWLM